MCADEVDEEAVAVTKSLEEDLRNQVELLTHELEESKKHHTPVRHLSLSLCPSLHSSFLPSSLSSFLSLLLLFFLSPFLSFFPPSLPSSFLLSLSLFILLFHLPCSSPLFFYLSLLCRRCITLIHFWLRSVIWKISNNNSITFTRHCYQIE